MAATSCSRTAACIRMERTWPVSLLAAGIGSKADIAAEPFSK